MESETIEEKIRRRHYRTTTTVEPRHALEDPEWEPDEIAYVEERARRARRALSRQVMQGERWLPKDGRDLAVEELTPEHRRHVLAFIERHASAIGRSVWSDMLNSAAAMGGEHATDAVESLAEEVHESLLADPTGLTWIRETPLHLRLTELEAATRRRSAAATLGWARRRFREATRRG